MTKFGCNTTSDLKCDDVHYTQKHRGTNRMTSILSISNEYKQNGIGKSCPHNLKINQKDQTWVDEYLPKSQYVTKFGCYLTLILWSKLIYLKIFHLYANMSIWISKRLIKIIWPSMFAKSTTPISSCFQPKRPKMGHWVPPPESISTID